MGVLVGEDGVTTFSYMEYQLLMLCLAGTICLGLLALEFSLRKIQVMPLLFPGMFSIRGKKFFFFDLEVRDVAIGRKLQGHTKLLVRMTLCVVLSYLWQQCVLKTSQMVGTEFPVQQCEDEADCFVAELHVMTLYKGLREHTAVDCSQPAAFDRRVVVSCIKFVNPSASTWLTNFAIAHSLTLLNLKSYEVMTWLSGNSRRVRYGIGILGFLTLISFIALFFSGVLDEFVSSWLSFVMSLSVPIFFYAVYASGKVLDRLWRVECSRVQQSIEEHLNSALKDFEPSCVDAQNTPRSRSRSNWVDKAGLSGAVEVGRQVFRMTGLPSWMPTRARTQTSLDDPNRSQSGSQGGGEDTLESLQGASSPDLDTSERIRQGA